MNGFLNLLKPTGMTASDVVVRARKILGEKKIGHLGTLDPGASGVLPLAVGKGTKLFDFLTFKTKRYRAWFTFGRTTPTLDSYENVSEQCGNLPSAKEIRQALPKLIGKLKQLPPQYSALSVAGVRAYRLARKGQMVDLPLREVEVTEFCLLRQESADTFVFDIVCSGGTYIRALCRDLAEELNTCAYMSALIRLSSGEFLLEDSYTLEELAQKKEKCLLPLDAPLGNIPVWTYPKEVAVKLQNGVKLTARFEGLRRIVCDNVLYGVADSADGKLNWKYYLFGG